MARLASFVFGILLVPVRSERAPGIRAAGVPQSLLEQLGQRAEFPVSPLVAASALASPLALQGAEAFSARAPHPPRAATRLSFAPPGREAAAPRAAATRLELFRRLRTRLRRLFRRPEAQPVSSGFQPELTPWFDRFQNLRLEEAGELHRDFSAEVAGTRFPVTLRIIDARDPAIRRDLVNEVGTSFADGDIASVFELAWHSYDDGRYVAILMEKLKATFRREVLGKDVNSIPRETKLRLLGEILRGAKQVFERNFAPHNINPDSVAVVGDCTRDLSDCNTKLVGFGLTADVEKARQGENGELGNIFYNAPEAWVTGGDLSKVDVWSMGRLAFELFVGDPMLRKGKDPKPYDIDLAGDKRFATLKKSDPAVANLIEKMLSKRAWLRPSIDAAYAMVEDILRKAGVDGVPEQPQVALPNEWYDTRRPKKGLVFGEAGREVSARRSWGS